MLAEAQRPELLSLEAHLACPRCRAPRGAEGPCPACQWTPRLLPNGVPDFVIEDRLNASHRSELAAQREAADHYYENERKICCHWDRITADRLAERLGWPKGPVLDLGCGTGTAGAGLVRQGIRVLGADLSPECLETARLRLDAVVRADAAHLPFRDGTFDALVARGALHHLGEPEAALREARRVLRPGGRALFMDPREYAWLERIKDRIRARDDAFSDHHRAFGRADYTRLIGEHFEILADDVEFPAAIMAAAGLDLVPGAERLPARPLAERLVQLDDFLGKTPLRRFGHLLIVEARRPEGD